MRLTLISAVMFAVASGHPAPALAQNGDHTPTWAPGKQRSANMQLVSHIPRGQKFSVGDVEIEQELSRPYAYVPRLFVHGFDIIDLKDLKKPRTIYSWRIQDAELHQGRGPMNGKYFKLKGRYYYVQGLQFGQAGPDSDVGAVVFDVTGLPDVSKVREVGRVRTEQPKGGFHNIFMYRHSDGRALLFATSGPESKVYDMEKFLAGAPDQGLIGRVPVPDTPGALTRTWHDFSIAFDPARNQDKFYGAGGGGYYIFDVTKPEEPQLLFTVTGVAMFNWGHTFTPTPDGKYAVGESEWQYHPLQIYDLTKGQDGSVKNINRSIAAWQSDWKTVAHMHEVRWPYVFVAGYETGLSVFNMMDPTNPRTVAYYDTYEGPHNKGNMSTGGTSNFTWGVYDGAWGVDVRNADGLIVISDMSTGFWAFKMEGFEGWNGNDWGMPNISSVQDWDRGPEGAKKQSKPVT